MAQVVMLTGLAGKDVDIVSGDICVCSTEEARRFLAVAFAREKTPADEGRAVKFLTPSASSTVGKSPSKPKAKTSRSGAKAKPTGDYVSLDHVPTSALGQTKAKLDQGKIDTLVAAELVSVELVRKATASQLKKLGGIAPTTIKKIRSATAEILRAATEAANTKQGSKPNAGNAESEETDEDADSEVRRTQGQEEQAGV